MKVIVGIDSTEHHKWSLNLAARLRFPTPEWTFAYSVDVTWAMTSYGISPAQYYNTNLREISMEAGNRALERAKGYACDAHINPSTTLLDGNAATALIQLADDEHADLICVHSERKGHLGSLFLGSVSRGLAIGASQSVLISKGEVEASGDLRLVFATDHSPYAKKALDKFIEMAPQGIAYIAVVTAVHFDDQGLDFDPSKLDTEGEKAFIREATNSNGEYLTRLRKAGYSCNAKLYDLPVNQAISKAMEEFDADLLVVGAQGHGFMHRLILGSTSLHQVVSEPHSMLILRPDAGRA